MTVLAKRNAIVEKIKSIIQLTTYRIAGKNALILSKKCLISKEKSEFAGCKEIWAQVLIVSLRRELKALKKQLLQFLQYIKTALNKEQENL